MWSKIEVVVGGKYIDFKILFRGEKLPGTFFCLVKKCPFSQTYPRCYIIYKHISMLYYIQTLKWVRLLPLAGENICNYFINQLEKNFSYFFLFFLYKSIDIFRRLNV